MGAKPADQLADFVGDALQAGQSRAEIATALRDAGWSDGEIAAALNAWAETDFAMPVPRPRPYVSAREAFAYGLHFVSLGVIVWHIATLGFELIDLWVDGPLRDWSYFNDDLIRWSIASLIVFLPVFFILDRRVLQKAQQDPAKRRSAVRKWFGYGALFLAAIALCVDVILVVYSFISGDLTLNFLCKLALVAALAALVVLYFRAELEGPEDA